MPTACHVCVLCSIAAALLHCHAICYTMYKYCICIVRRYPYTVSHLLCITTAHHPTQLPYLLLLLLLLLQFHPFYFGTLQCVQLV